MAVMFLGAGTLQTEANKRCAEFAVYLKGQKAHGDPIQLCLGRESLTVAILSHFPRCCVLGAQPHSL